METGLLNLRKQLALAVRRIHWSYSIFWSISSSDSRVLEWSEGYYNGEIKTRKTVQAVEFNADESELQRSEQLRQLYEFLLTSGETNSQTKRLSASLSPEDLSNTEWYYLVCMSFTFDLGQGLPGRALESGQPIWLSNAHQADSTVFGRSLLAKSASIQTVVCFPFLGGVIELGITDMVLEDHTVIQYAQASLLGIDCPMLVPCEENESSSGNGLVQPLHESSSMVEGVDDELSNSAYTSITSIDCCISRNLINSEVVDEISPQEHDTEDHLKDDDTHYKNVVMSLFKGSHKSILEHCVRDRDTESSFVRWRKKGIGSCLKNSNGVSSQRVLKKILIEVPRMCGGCSDELASSHVIAERRGRERVNDKFEALKLLIPSIDKVDKVSILDDTINHLTELKRRIQKLESCQDFDECRVLTKPQDMSERTSGKFDNNNNNCGVKRKADVPDEMITRLNSMNTNISINLNEKDVLIKLKCPWKGCLLLDIIDALSKLKLDTHSIQSSTSHTFLSIIIKAKISGLKSTSAGKIRQVLQRVVMKVG